jgi:hypothetical protein
MESYLIDVVGHRFVGVVWLIGGDLEQILLSNGSIEARAVVVAVVLLGQWGSGSTHA